MNLPLHKIDSSRGDFFVVKTERHQFHFGFGNRHFTIEDLREQFPNMVTYRLQQVHGVEIIPPSPNQLPEADGHFAHDSGEILTIQTADCLPALAFNTETGVIMALHAGWRGLFGGIVHRGLSMPVLQPLNDCYVFAGPHIQKDSFEVQDDVFSIIKAALHRAPTLKFSDIVSPTANGRFCVDLAKFLRAETDALGLSEKNLWISTTDTFTSSQHFSYRRQNPRGRLISYIARMSLGE